METSEIYEKLIVAFHDVFDDETILVHPELTAKDVDEWDSLTHIRLVLTVEKSFKIKFSASEISKLKNVGEFVDLIKSKT